MGDRGAKVEMSVSSMNLKDLIKELAKIPRITAKAAESLVDAGVRSEADLKQLGGDRVEEITKATQGRGRRALANHSDRPAEVTKAVPEGDRQRPWTRRR